MARIYQTRAWHDQLSPSLPEFELLALEIYAHLPDEFRKLTGEIVIQVAEFPTDEIMDDLALETPFDLLGLFEGRGIAEEAARGVLDWLFTDQKWPSVISLVDPSNDTSVKLVEKLGARAEGTFAHDMAGEFRIWRHVPRTAAGKRLLEGLV